MEQGIDEGEFDLEIDLKTHLLELEEVCKSDGNICQ